VYVSVVVATIIAVLFNFKTYGALVFKSKDNSKVFRFIGVYLCTMCIQMMLLKALSAAGITSPYIAGGIILLPVSLLSFFLMRKFVFKNVVVDAPGK
jgi:putative flippase GtrA